MLAGDPQGEALAAREEGKRGTTAPRGARREKRKGGARAARGDSGARLTLHDEVTARIVAELEAGRIPWTQPWDAAACPPGLPRNADSGRAYSGINILILWAEAAERGFASQRWLTFRQALAVGGHVRKGEKGVTIFYAARFSPKDDDGAAGRDGSASRGDAADAARSVPFLKRFTVFNTDQCEDLPPRCHPADIPFSPHESLPKAELLIAASGADFRIGGDDAYYAHKSDYVMVPPIGAFLSAADYYCTALHELGHWTGHPSRLARDLSGDYGSASYAREELCAELASAFLCAALGLAPIVRHADYIGDWLAIMRADTRAIFKAASLASKAADYLLAFAPAAEAGDGAAAASADAGAGQ